MAENRLTKTPRRKADKPEKAGALPQEILDRLAHLAILPANWDSYGGSPINPKAVEKAKTILLEALAMGGEGIPLPFIAPSPDGGLELEWTTSSGKELMLEIPPEEGPVAFLLVEPTVSGEEEETEGTLGESYTLDEVIRRLLVR